MTDWRDLLIGLNIVSMIGGAFYLVGMLRTQIHENTQAIRDLRNWLEKESERLRKVEIEVARIERAE